MHTNLYSVIKDAIETKRIIEVFELFFNIIKQKLILWIKIRLPILYSLINIS